MNNMDITGLIMLVMGLILAGIEMTIPGFGIAGISGIILMGLGVVMLAETVTEGILIILALVVVLGIMLSVVMMWLKKRKTPWILQGDVKGGEEIPDIKDLEVYVGRRGKALTDLRPAGMGRFEDKDLEVLSEGMFIEKGKDIVVSMIRDRKIMVKEI
ncbi:MAG: hypothetical protein IKD69_13425 [Solobacterium sp.]|nr:hypothetical protein [Solobacterium sp.]